MAEAPSFSLDSHEMRCLSVIKPMTFMMAAEFDIFLAATQARDNAFVISFPPLQAEYRRALHLCATRFQLGVERDDGTGPVDVTGKARLPLLRYVDFLPGLLHLDEILSVAGARITRTEPTPAADSAPGALKYVACCTDYAAFKEDEPKFEAGAFFHTIDRGLPLATMAHLIRFEVARIASAGDAVKSFQRFSHWNQFDLRWDDEDTKQAAVIVMPSTADVHEIFDKYEDEATDDEATVLFRLRPVAPCAHVPYLEDALIRRLRDQNWDDVKRAWAGDSRHAHGVPPVVVANLSQSASIQDLVAPFGKPHVVEAALVMETGPHKRRKLYLQFDSPEAARAALAQDGQRIAALPGKPVVRVQVAPPFINAARRGHLLASLANDGSRSPSPQADMTPQKDGAAEEGGSGKKNRRGSVKDSAKKASPQPERNAQNAKAAAKNDGRKSRSPQQASLTPPPAEASAPPAAGPGKKGPGSQSTVAPAATDGKPSRAMGGGKASTQDPPTPSSEAPAEPQRSSTSATPVDRQQTEEPAVASGSMTRLNSAATPFVPSSCRTVPPTPNNSFAAPPPPYMGAAAGLMAPPPYMMAPPSYGMIVGASPGGVPAVPPPPYMTPPAYAAAPALPPPPPYHKTPGGTAASAPPPPPPYAETVAVTTTDAKPEAAP